MGEVQFALRLDKEKRNKLAEMSRDVGINSAGIARNAIYKAIAEWEQGQQSNQKEAA